MATQVAIHDVAPRAVMALARSSAVASRAAHPSSVEPRCAHAEAIPQRRAPEVQREKGSRAVLKPG
jgi:hypothetical protein